MTYMYSTRSGHSAFCFQGCITNTKQIKILYTFFCLFFFNNLSKDAFNDPPRKDCKQSNSMRVDVTPSRRSQSAAQYTYWTLFFSYRKLRVNVNIFAHMQTFRISQCMYANINSLVVMAAGMHSYYICSAWFLVSYVYVSHVLYTSRATVDKL